MSLHNLHYELIMIDSHMHIFQRLLEQPKWSVFYIISHCMGESDDETVKDLTFDEAVALIRALPKKWNTHQQHSNKVICHCEGKSDQILDLPIDHCTESGPHLSFGAHEVHVGECDVGFYTSPITFDKDEILALIDSK